MALKKFNVSALTWVWTSTGYTVPAWKDFVVGFLWWGNVTNIITWKLWIKADSGAAYIVNFNWWQYASSQALKWIIFKAWETVNVFHTDTTTSDIFLCWEEIDANSNLKVLSVSWITVVNTWYTTWYTVPVWKMFMITNAWSNSQWNSNVNGDMAVKLGTHSAAVDWYWGIYDKWFTFKGLIATAGDEIFVSHWYMNWTHQSVIYWEEMDI